MPAALEGADDLQKRLASIASSETRRALMNAMGRATVQRAIHKAPSQTAYMRRSIKVTSVSSDQVMVTAQANYAANVEFGTKPHIIRPRLKKALFFASQKLVTERFGKRAKLSRRKTGSLTSASLKRYGNAAFQYARVVHHPGTKPQPFLVPAAREVIEASGEAKDIIIAKWNRAA
jgi:HK97 gp10 family phage protein